MDCQTKIDKVFSEWSRNSCQTILQFGANCGLIRAELQANSCRIARHPRLSRITL